MNKIESIVNKVNQRKYKCSDRKYKIIREKIGLTEERRIILDDFHIGIIWKGDFRAFLLRLDAAMELFGIEIKDVVLNGKLIATWSNAYEYHLTQIVLLKTEDEMIDYCIMNCINQDSVKKMIKVDYTVVEDGE